ARTVMRHKHALDVVAVAQLEQRLARLAVGARLLAHRLDRRPAKRTRPCVACLRICFARYAGSSRFPSHATSCSLLRSLTAGRMSVIGSSVAARLKTGRAHPTERLAALAPIPLRSWRAFPRV